MPKLKTNKAARKRFKLTAKGKALRSRTSRRHLLTDKTGQAKRKLRGWTVLDKTDRKRLNALLPYH